MKHKTAGLRSPLLDAAVALAEGVKVRWSVADDFCVEYTGGDDTGLKERRGPRYLPSLDWSIGGPIIEREGIGLACQKDASWNGHLFDHGANMMLVDADGATPLIAAMRAFVAAKLGQEVELPEGGG